MGAMEIPQDEDPTIYTNSGHTCSVNPMCGGMRDENAWDSSDSSSSKFREVATSYSMSAASSHKA